MLALTMIPALLLLAVGAWAVASALGVAGAVGPWEEVAASGRRVVELAEPGADPALSDALAAHRAELSASLTQARRWAFVGERFLDVLPWLVIGVALALFGLAAAASRRLARELARPIQELVVLADRMGRGDQLPAPSASSVREVRALDHALRDAADRLVEARERAVASERLRVWGEMARRVAHEMKNPLTPLRLAVHRLARAAEAGQSGVVRPSGDPVVPGDGIGRAGHVEHPGNGSVAEVAEVVAQEVGRLEELAAQFSALGRPPEGPATGVDLRELVTSLVETDLPSSVMTEVSAPGEAVIVVAHYDALVRAFRNLIRNAVEAMDGVPDARLEVGVHEAVGMGSAGGWIEVRIADNGVGLPEGRAHRIFEPDFTTKTRGTGLGLTLVRQAIEAHGGSVEARSRERGAEFIVRLPNAAATPVTDSEKNQHETSAH
jgi:signal transduction histidine kinase